MMTFASKANESLCYSSSVFIELLISTLAGNGHEPTENSALIFELSVAFPMVLFTRGTAVSRVLLNRCKDLY